MPVALATGHRMYTVHVEVDPTLSWVEAIDAVNTQRSGRYDLEMLGEMFPPEMGELAERSVLLVNFGPDMRDKTIPKQWMVSNRRRPASARTVLAIGAQKIFLRQELNLPQDAHMTVMSLDYRTYWNLPGNCIQVRYSEDGARYPKLDRVFEERLPDSWFASEATVDQFED